VVEPRPLLREGAVLAEGPDHAVPGHYGAPLREQRRLEAGHAVVDLGQMQLLSVAGPDARSWLTTITSQVFTDIPVGSSVSVTVLSPQGRLEQLASAAVTGDEEVMLITDPGTRDGWRHYLEMMRFAARVELTDRDDLRVLGGTVPATQALEDSPVRLPEPVLVWEDPWPAVVPGGVSYGPDPEDPTRWVLSVFDQQDLLSQPWRVEDLAGTAAAEALRIANHRPRQVTEADERTIPHELDLLRTAVHTAKGCYRGQETVAKVLNLGQPPRRLVMLHLDGSQDVPAAAGGPVLLGGADGKNVGRVTTAAVHMDLGPIALAVVKRSVPLDAPLTVGVHLHTQDGDDAQDEAGALDRTADAQAPDVFLDAAQEPIVVPRDHGERPRTPRL
jgi:folate-binding protein YgfZ